MQNRSIKRQITFAFVNSLFQIVMMVTSLSIGAMAQTTNTDGSTPLSLTPGSPAGSYALSGFENINLFNGNLNFHLPLLGVTGRGDARMQMTLPIDQRWRVDSMYSEYGGYFIYSPNYNWWSGLKPGYGPGVLHGRTAYPHVPSCEQYSGGTILTRLTFTGPDGTEYEFRDQATGGRPMDVAPCVQWGASRGQIFVTADGNAATFTSDTIIYDNAWAQGEAYSLFYPTGYLTLKDGMRYRIENGLVKWMRDRNGNKLTFTYDTYGEPYGPANRVTSIKDSLNRQITITYDVQDIQPYGLCDKIEFRGFSGFAGGNRTIRVSRKNLANALSPGFGLQTYYQLFPELNGSCSSCTHNPVVTSAVWLPNGQSYTFFYNSYSELARVKLPSGGSYEYDYAAGLSNGPISGVFRGGTEVYRRVIEKRGYKDDNVLATTSRFSRPESLSGELIQTTGFVDADGRDSIGNLLSRSRHYFYGFAAAESAIGYYPWKTGKQHKIESIDVDGATVLRRTTQVWQLRASVSWWSSWCPGCPADNQPDNDSRVIESRSELTDVSPALVSQQTYGYDDTVPYNNRNNVKEYDFGNGAPGALFRETRTTFITASGYTDTSVHLRGLPTQVSVYDGGGVERARSTFEYDNYTQDGNHAALINRSGISSFDSAFNTSYLTRGNVTASTNYLLTNGAVTGSVSNYLQYDIAGNVVKTIDGRGYATTLDFSDRFGSPDGNARLNSEPLELSSVGQASYAFASSATNALGQTVYTQRDYYLSKPVDGEDANGIVSSSYYNDALDRPTQAKQAVGTSAESHTSSSYDDAGRATTSSGDLNSTGDGVLTSKSLYDGLGRTTETRQYEGGTNYIATQTEYDALGQPFKTSNPFRPWQGENALWTTTMFDALGRVKTVTTPDGAVTNTTYSGNTFTSTDQAAKVKRSLTDAIGRLTRVDEPDTNGNLGAVTSPNQATSYTYDVLNSLITVSQGSQTRTFVYDSLNRLTSSANPESGTTNYQYDNNGNLTQKTDSRVPAVTTTYVYDALNRATTRTYSDGTPAVTYVYDSGAVLNSKGRITSVSSSVSGTNYNAYDPLGRITAGNQVTDGLTYSTSYTYNRAGNQISATYPSGRVIASEYDAAGRIAGVRDQQSGIYYAGALGTDVSNRVQYAAHGAVSVMKLGNGLWEHTNFNNRFQPTQIGLGSSSADSTTMGLTYDYGSTNNNGNILSLTYTCVGLSYTQTFGSDHLNRLITSVESGTSWSQTNKYDRYGNRWIDLGGGNQSLYFNTTNNRITTAGYAYDPAGNLTNDGLHSYGFDAENRIKTVDSVSDIYRYDADGNRVRKSFAQGENVRMVYSGGQLIAEYDLSTNALKKEYVYGARGLVATVEPATGTRYVTTDHLGSPRVITSATGSVISRHDYMPFGEELGAGMGGRTTGLGFSIADGIRQKFTSKERDAETGLDNFLARYHSSTQGRFTSVDPEGAGGRGSDPRSWNGYAYAGGNPVVSTDPDGREYLLCDPDGKNCVKLPDEAFYKGRRESEGQGYKFTGDRNFFENGQVKGANGEVLYTYVQISIDDPVKQFIFEVRKAVNPIPMATVQFFGLSAIIGTGGGIVAYAAPAALPFIAPAVEKLSITGPTTAITLLSKTNNPTLRNVINNLYRAAARIGSGSTADAIRYERATGRLLSPAGHSIKGRETIASLEKLIRSGKLNPAETNIAKFLINDLKDALK